MKEGQTQEPVGGMKTAKEIVQKHKSIESRQSSNRMFGGYLLEYLNLHSAELAVEEYHNQFTQPIKTEGEDEKDLWNTALNFFQGEYILKPDTTKEEVISELMSTYKISKR